MKKMPAKSSQAASSSSQYFVSSVRSSLCAYAIIIDTQEVCGAFWDPNYMGWVYPTLFTTGLKGLPGEKNVLQTLKHGGVGWKMAKCKLSKTPLIPDFEILWGEWGHIELKSWLDRPSGTFCLYGGPLRPVVAACRKICCCLRSKDSMPYSMFLFNIFNNGKGSSMHVTNFSTQKQMSR